MGSAVNLAKLLGALGQIDDKLDWIGVVVQPLRPGPDHRGGADLDLNNVYINDATTPFEVTDVPAIPQYETLFDTYLPKGLKTASLGLNSFAAWLLFAQSAKACGATITRLCVYGNGCAHDVVRRRRPERRRRTRRRPRSPTQCFVPVVATSKGFTSIDWNANDGPYNCDPQNVIPLTGDYGKAMKLADVGKSLDDLR